MQGQLRRMCYPCVAVPCLCRRPSMRSTIVPRRRPWMRSLIVPAEKTPCDYLKHVALIVVSLLIIYFWLPVTSTTSLRQQAGSQDSEGMRAPRGVGGGGEPPRRRCCIVGAPGRGTAVRARPCRARAARAAPPGPRGARGIAGPARSRRARAAVALGCTANRKRYNRRRVGPVV